jgi:hypothetical protein
VSPSTIFSETASVWQSLAKPWLMKQTRNFMNYRPRQRICSTKLNNQKRTFKFCPQFGKRGIWIEKEVKRKPSVILSPYPNNISPSRPGDATLYIKGFLSNNESAQQFETWYQSHENLVKGF